MSARREPRERSPEHQSDDEDPHPWRPANPALSFRHAADGISETLRTQRNMRFHVVALAVASLLGLFFHIAPLEWVALLSVCTVVILAELFNTAIETVVDMITREYHPGAKIAKDVGAGAVLIAAILAVAVGAILFLPRLPQIPDLLIAQLKPVGVVVGATILLLLLAAVRVAKQALFSAHIASAFFLATAVALLAGNALVAVLAVTLALLLTHSRATARPHTMREVISSVALGLGLALAGTCLPMTFGANTSPKVIERGERPLPLAPR